MLKTETSSYILRTKDEKERLELLLRLNNFSKESFCIYMGIEADILNDIPQWAVNYLKDMLDANLSHLGYVIKDTKTDGMLKPIKTLVNNFSQDITTNQDNYIPIEIKEDIVSEQGDIKVSYIANIEAILRERSKVS